MARRVIEEQVGMFDVMLGGSAGEATSSAPFGGTFP